MSDSDSGERRQLLEVLLALRPYLGHLTIIGGWVPALYKQYGGLGWDGAISFTTEVDVLVGSLPVEGGESLETRLRGAGFAPALEGGPSAVWSQVEAPGSEIEFLGPHTGPVQTMGQTGQLIGHGLVGSIRLADLAIMAAHTTTLRIPVKVSSELQHLDLRLPILGAYLVNKGATYPNRQAHASGDNPKRAKDLLYVRDVLAGGSEVVAQIATDLKRLRSAGVGERTLIRKARNNLDMTLKGQLYPPALDAAAAMLSEREGLEPIAARADVVGHLRDALELLSDE